MPPEQLEKLGVGYRRIPVMVIGQDSYCNSRLMLINLRRPFQKHDWELNDHSRKALSMY